MYNSSRYFNVGSRALPQTQSFNREPQRHFGQYSAPQRKPNQPVQQPKQEEQRQPSAGMAYLLECEMYAKLRFRERLLEAYEHASRTPGVPAVVTTPAPRGSYGPRGY